MSNVFGPKKPLFGPYTYRAKQNSNGDTLIAVYHGSKRIAHIDAYWAYSMRAIEEHEAEEAQRASGSGGTRRRLVCASDLRALGAEGRYPNVLRVGHAFVDDEAYKGKGIGRAMYEAMMAEGFAVRETRVGGQPGPMFLIPDECGGAGNTSADAKRVWASLARDYPSQGTSIRVDAPPVIGSRAKVNPRRRNSAKTREEDENVPDCAWCGAACDQPHPYPNRRGEVFCSPSHRSASNRALARVLDEHGGSSPRRRRNPRDPQTETPAFKEWFRDSKIVDAEGNPLVVYHGGFDVLNSRNGTFRKSKTGALGSGIYFTPDRSAAEYYMAHRGGYEAVENGVLTEVYLSVQNPLVVRPTHAEDPAVEALVLLGEERDRAYDKVEKIRERLGDIGATLPNAARAAGYDGIIRIGWRDGKVAEILVFEPWQVKSATRNAGTYYPYGSDIRTNPRRNPDRWRRGKCLVFAEALKRVAGRKGTLYDVVEVTLLQTLPHHVVLRIGDTYWDSEGPSTEAELLARWAARAPAGVYLPLRLEKHDPKRAQDFRYPSMNTCSVDDRAAALLHAERMLSGR